MDDDYGMKWEFYAQATTQPATIEIGCDAVLIGPVTVRDDKGNVVFELKKDAIYRSVCKK